MKILDCTLRDGGYYNNWDFSSELVELYLKSVATAGIDYIELGLRNFSKEGFYGAFAYTTEDFLSALSLPKGPKYGVMVDAKTILSSHLSVEEAVNALFVNSNESKLDFVRIAAHFNEVLLCEPIVRALNKKGYLLGFNLMQAGGKSSELIKSVVDSVRSWASIDVLYFADSLGNMNSEEVQRIYTAIRSLWSGDVGIHAHNNMGLALENTVFANKIGVEWLDSTISGMGRGAGNTPTENLLAYIRKSNDHYFPNQVYKLVIKYFEKMKKEYGWGSNLMYFLGAQENVHPTYIQKLLSDSHFGVDEVIGAIEYLSRLESSSSFEDNQYQKALTLHNESKTVSGCSTLHGIFNDKDVLLVANGPSLYKYLPDIERYIKDRKPVVIAINAITTLSSELVDYYCISRNTKFLSEKKLYKDLAKPVILPKHRFLDDEINTFCNTNIIDYGMSVESNCLKVNKTYAVVPFDVTAAYAFAVIHNMGVQSIDIVGFDGYESNDIRQSEMLDIISVFKNKFSIRSLTPTTYPVNKGSIYAPDI